MEITPRKPFSRFSRARLVPTRCPRICAIKGGKPRLSCGSIGYTGRGNTARMCIHNRIIVRNVFPFTDPLRKLSRERPFASRAFGVSTTRRQTYDVTGATRRGPSERSAACDTRGCAEGVMQRGTCRAASFTHCKIPRDECGLKIFCLHCIVERRISTRWDIHRRKSRCRLVALAVLNLRHSVSRTSHDTMELSV